MQRARQEQATESEVKVDTSLATVKTLLSTGVGCISYLRGLFSDDNFVDERISAPPRASITSEPPTSSQIEEKKNGGVKVKKLNRGHSKEADKLIDYIEIGAADAIEKSYLSQLLLAIYLDPEKPADLVECYSFNFTYQLDRAGNKVPEMVMQDKLSGMMLTGDKDKGKKSTRSGTTNMRLPKEAHIKRQVQQLIKRLITTTQSLDDLPQRRFVNIRLFYTDDCPENYEPPLFKSAPPDQENYVLATPHISDAPQHIPIGKLSTGYHSVTLDVVSVAQYTELPQEGIGREAAIEHNQRDAATRPVIWNPQMLFNAAVGDDMEVGPDGVRDEEGAIMKVDELEKSDDLNKVELKARVGLADKSVATMVKGKGKGQEKERMDADGADNDVLRRAIASTSSAREDDVPGTQVAPVLSRQLSNQPSQRPPVPFFDESPQEYHHRAKSLQGGSHPSTSQLQPLSQNLPPVMEDVESPSSERAGSLGRQKLIPFTQVPEEVLNRFPVSSMNAFEIADDETQLLEYTQAAPRDKTPPVVDQWQASSTFDSLGQVGAWARARHLVKADGPCECGDPAEDTAMIECSSCKGWKHVVCYGFHNSKDKRIPELFYCYPCRVVCSPDDALINPKKESDIENALDDLSSLALFRRAIAVIWADGAMSAAKLAKRLGITSSTVSSINTRLREERFLVEAPIKGGKKSQAKKMQTVANKSREQNKTKNEVYFSPSEGAELGLTYVLDCSDRDADGDILSRGATLAKAAPNQMSSQDATQDESLDQDVVTDHKSLTQASLHSHEQPPIPQDQENAAQAQAATRVLSVTPAQDEDPIEDDSDDDGSRTVEERKSKAPVVVSKPLYVPRFRGSKQPNPQAAVSSDFHRASSAFGQASHSMDVDESQEPETIDEPMPVVPPLPAKHPPTAASNKRGREVESAAAIMESPTSGKKSKKSSNAGDLIEVR